MEQLLTRWDVFPIPQEFKGLYYKRHSGGSAWTETRVEQMADDTVKIDFSPPESKCQQIQKKKKKAERKSAKKKTGQKALLERRIQPCGRRILVKMKYQQANRQIDDFQDMSKIWAPNARSMRI